MLPRPDRIRLRHMLEEARRAMAFVKGRTFGDLQGDEVLQYAVVRAISIVGEAAAQVSKDTRDALGDVPWPDIIGMRHRLIHGYHDVSLDVVWRTVTQDLPPLAGYWSNSSKAMAPEAPTTRMPPPPASPAWSRRCAPSAS